MSYERGREEQRKLLEEFVKVKKLSWLEMTIFARPYC